MYKDRVFFGQILLGKQKVVWWNQNNFVCSDITRFNFTWLMFNRGKLLKVYNGPIFYLFFVNISGLSVHASSFWKKHNKEHFNRPAKAGMKAFTEKACWVIDILGS